MRILLVVLGLLVARPVFAEPDWLTHGLLTAQMFAQGVDAGQSMYLLGRGHREINPVLAPFAQQPVAFGAVKFGLAAASSFWMLKYHEKHPRLVRIAAVVQTSVLVTVIAHNDGVRRRGHG